MRLFIAIDLSQEIKDYVNKIQNDFNNFPGKFSFPSPENSHITLKFLGNVAEDKAEGIQKRLREIDFKPFNAYTGDFGVFPNENYIRVFWLGLEDDGELAELAENVKHALPEFKEDHKFHAHITLARVKFLKEKEEFIREMKSMDVKNIKFKVDTFKLMQSKLRGSKGAEHTVVEEYS